MQPFERLRSLARWGDSDEELLVEIAGCLAEFDDDPAGLVVACRRLLDHHRDWGALWWLCSRVLASPQPAAAATEALSLVAADATPSRLARALPFPADGPIAVLGWPLIGPHLVAERVDLTVISVLTDPFAESDLPPVDEVDAGGLAELAPTHLLVEPPATSDVRVTLPTGGRAAIDRCPAVTRLWLVTPVGTVLPERLVAALAAAASLSESVAPSIFDRVVSGRGLSSPETLVERLDAPVAPELLRPLR